jgi:RNA polymerase sigma-70 factor (ECF subfamily)
MSSFEQIPALIKPSQLTDSDLSSFRERLKSQARRWMGPKLRTRVESSDLIQETFFFTISRLSQLLDRPKSEVYRWMVSVLKYRLLRHVSMMEKEPHHGLVCLLQEPMVQIDVVDGLISGELRMFIDREVQLLAPVSREIFQLHYVEGLKLCEIAGRLNKSQSAVRSVHHRLLEELQLKIAKHVK